MEAGERQEGSEKGRKLPGRGSGATGNFLRVPSYNWAQRRAPPAVQLLLLPY